MSLLYWNVNFLGLETLSVLNVIINIFPVLTKVTSIELVLNKYSLNE